MLLPEAFRSLSRPSSAPDAKAFPLRSFTLDLVWSLVLNFLQESCRHFKEVYSFRWLIVLPLIKKSPQLNFEFFIPLCCLTFVYHNHFVQFSRCIRRCIPSKLNNDIDQEALTWSKKNTFLRFLLLLRKEVIQPHLPIRLPCYDFTPIIEPTFDGVLLAVRLPASGVPDSHGVTGGVYKARERIHRGMLIRDY